MAFENGHVRVCKDRKSCDLGWKLWTQKTWYLCFNTCDLHFLEIGLSLIIFSRLVLSQNFQIFEANPGSHFINKN